jgi:hypothetical protein
MSETPGPGRPESLEHTADELEERLDRLEEHLSEAEEKAEERREEAAPGTGVAGDWEDTRGTPGQGEDPEGA